MYRCPHCGAFNRVPDPPPPGAPVCGKCHNALDLSGRPQDVDGEALKRAIESSPVPVLVDFWADWCAPCKVAAPILEQLAQARKGKLVVLKLDTEKNAATSQALGIRGIPTFILFVKGRERARQSGVLPLPAFSGWVDQALAGPPAGAEHAHHA